MVKGKVACITGGIGSIGSKFASVLVTNGIKGITLVDVHNKDDPRVTAIIKTLGEHVNYIQADVKSPYQIECALIKTVKHFGNFDILINNAGIVNEYDLELMLRINYISVLYGTMLSIYKYMPPNLTHEEGIVVNNTCIFGIIPFPLCPLYSVTSHASVAVGRAFGTPFYYNRSKVKVLTLCPGYPTSPLSATPLPANADLLDPDIRKIREDRSSKAAKGLMKMLKEGKNGSVWVCGNKEVYQHQFVDRFEYYKKLILKKEDEDRIEKCKK